MAKVTLSLKERAYLLTRGLVGSLDTRSDTLGQQLLSRLYPGATTEPPRRGTKAFLEAYTTSPWLRAVEGRIAAQTAAVTWRLYSVRRTRAARASRDKLIQRTMQPLERKSLLAEREAAGELIEIQDHLWLTALDRGPMPPQINGLGLRKLVQIWFDCVGEVYLLRERNALGTPVAYWPLAPHWVINTPTPDNPTYRVSIRGLQAEIPETEVLRMVDLDPANPYGRGSGVAMAVADELDTDEFMAKTLRQRFFNQARPDFIVFPKNNDTLSTPDAKRMETDWLNKNQGFWRWFKPHFATRELGIYEFQMDFSKLQLSELRKNERDMILQVTGGIPPEMLGIVENSNRATISAAKYLMDTQVIIPRLEAQRAVYQDEMVREFDDRLIVDYVSPVEADEASQLEAMKAAPWTPTNDEWRKKQGLSPLEDSRAGTAHMMPAMLTPIESLAPEEMDDEDLTTLENLVPPPAPESTDKPSTEDDDPEDATAETPNS